MSTNEALREIIFLAESAIRETGRETDKTSALDIAAKLLPDAKLYASQAADGKWHYYLVMPKEWSPGEDDGHWILNPSTYCYWTSGTGIPWEDGTKWATNRTNTETQALTAGFKRLVEVL